MSMRRRLAALAFLSGGTAFLFAAETLPWARPAPWDAAPGTGSPAGGPATAPAAATAPPAAPPPDYSAGFERLFALGLPDVPGTAWMQLAGQRSTVRANGQTLAVPPAGFFAEPTAEDGLARAVQGALEMSYLNIAQWLAAHPGPEPEQRAAVNALIAQSTRPVWLTTAAPADLAAHIAQVQSWAVTSAQLQSGPAGAWPPADLLLFAAHVHRLGHTAAANRLAAALFANHDRREVLAGAVRQIALARYFTALQQANRTGDWAVLVRALDEILTRYGEAWPERPLVARVREAAQKQATVPNPPVLPGAEWSAEDRQFAAAVLARLVAGDYAQVPWLFPVASTEPAGPAAPPRNALSELLAARGGRAVPVLVELACDENLAAGGWTQTNAVGALGRLNMMARRGELSERDRARFWENGFPRPRTRGEMVRQILQPVLPPELARTNAELPEDYADWEKWAQEAAILPPAALARRYLEATGEPYLSSAQDLAMDWLARNAAGEDAAFLEEKIATVPDLDSVSHAALLYVRRRGADAKPFAEKLQQRVADDLAGLSPERANETGQLISFRNQLNDIVSGKSLAERIRELPAVQENWAQALSLVEAHFLQEPLTPEIVAALVATTLALKGEHRAAALMLLLRSLELNAGRPGESLLAAEMRRNPAPWRSLLADRTRRHPYETMTAGDIAAVTVFAALRQNAAEADGDPRASLLGARLYARHQTIAVKLLAGEKAAEPLLPEPVPLPPGKLAALTAAARAGDRTAWNDKITQLGDGEYLSWLERLQKDAALGKTAAPLVNQVAEFSSNLESAGPAMTAWGKTAPARPLNAAALHELLAAAAQELQAGRGGTARLQREPGGTGWTVLLSNSDFNGGALSPFGDYGSVMVEAQVEGPDGRSVSWQSQYPRGAAAPEAPDEDGEKDFQELLQALFAGEIGRGRAALVMLQFVPPAKEAE